MCRAIGTQPGRSCGVSRSFSPTPARPPAPPKAFLTSRTVRSRLNKDSKTMPVSSFSVRAGAKREEGLQNATEGVIERRRQEA